LVVFGLGEKQSSPTLTRVFVTVNPSTLSESKPSVFFGRAFSSQCHDTDDGDGVEAYRSIVAESLNVYIIEGDILGTDQESRPAGTVEEGNTFDVNIGSIVSQEEDRSVVSVAGILS
jgi:hypothetical protein